MPTRNPIGSVRWMIESELCFAKPSFLVLDGILPDDYWTVVTGFRAMDAMRVNYTSVCTVVSMIYLHLN
jgi:hypothetical protein